MGLFDFFSREQRETKPISESEEREISEKTEEKKDNPIAIFTPTSYSEVEKIIDKFKEGKNAIVYLNKLKTETAIRVLDMLSGAIYALNGGIFEMEKNVFMFSPSGVEVN